MADDFSTTRWSRILAADDDGPQGQRARAWLAEAYWYPLYAFARRRGHGEDRAAELVQSFFVRMIERPFVGDLDPAVGTFRSFLLAAFKNFVANELAGARALKRRAQDARFTVSLDAAEAIYRREPSTDLSPENLYERRWATTILTRATERLGRDYERLGRPELFEALRGFLTGEADGPYEETAERLDMTVGAVTTAIHRMRKRLGRVLRAEVAATVADGGSVDDEIRHLLRVLG